MSSPPPDLTYPERYAALSPQPLKLAENIVPLSDFKAQTASMLRLIADDNQPRVLTQNGKAAAVVLSPAAYDELTAHARFLTALNEGLTDVREGRVYTHDEVVARMRDRFAAPAPKRAKKKRAK